MDKRDHPRKGPLARSQAGSSKPWGLSDPRPGHWALQVTRKSSLLNSIRILENFCTVISSELLLQASQKGKVNSKIVNY